MVIDSMFVYHFVNPGLRVEMLRAEKVDQKMGSLF